MWIAKSFNILPEGTAFSRAAEMYYSGRPYHHRKRATHQHHHQQQQHIVKRQGGRYILIKPNPINPNNLTPPHPLHPRFDLQHTIQKTPRPNPLVLLRSIPRKARRSYIKDPLMIPNCSRPDPTTRFRGRACEMSAHFMRSLEWWIGVEGVYSKDDVTRKKSFLRVMEGSGFGPGSMGLLYISSKCG